MTGLELSADLAHKIFAKGHVADALKLSRDLIIAGYPAAATPIAKCFSRLVIEANLQGSSEDAYNLLSIGLRYGHYDPDLDMAFETFRRSSDLPQSGKLIFGLGTGRSGSTSLQQILNNCENHYISHEHPFLVRWEGSLQDVDWHLKRMAWLSEYYDLVGDVSHWWLPHVEYIMQAAPEASFLALKRPKELTVDSFLKQKGPLINHWTNHDGDFFQKNIWDPCYPKYGHELPLEDALVRYWDDYYERCELLAAAYPSRFVMLDLDLLSSDCELRGALASIGVEVELNSVKSRFNVGSMLDGDKINAIPLRALRGQ